jgi:hypothetical protein
MFCLKLIFNSNFKHFLAAPLPSNHGETRGETQGGIQEGICGTRRGNQEGNSDAYNFTGEERVGG